MFSPPKSLQNFQHGRISPHPSSPRKPRIAHQNVGRNAQTGLKAVAPLISYRANRLRPIDCWCLYTQEAANLMRESLVSWHVVKPFCKTELGFVKYPSGREIDLSVAFALVRSVEE
ncbi:hypothetical protein CEXT_484821 [Caerostris extrusa]|uniref:Uncharacterized protein n=1 Tax=Caerostris extrusa TaxID=172846 RepID=A0AAV4VJ21_CAEEX|nr:hypothetical protein CEXT_484821 [Caerostris extrusa]